MQLSNLEFRDKSEGFYMTSSIFLMNKVWYYSENNPLSKFPLKNMKKDYWFNYIKEINKGVQVYIYLSLSTDEKINPPGNSGMVKRRLPAPTDNREVINKNHKHVQVRGSTVRCKCKMI